MERIPSETTEQEILKHEEPIKLRCPSCFKLYAVDTREIRETRPQFACVACQSRFWMAYPESLGRGEIVGFPIEWLYEKDNEELGRSLGDGPESSMTGFGATKPQKKSEKSLFQEPSTETKKAAESFAKRTQEECPKCGIMNRPESVECEGCGIVIARYRRKQRDFHLGAHGSYTLRENWDRVLNLYDSARTHEQFIKLCQKESNLDYAAKKYGEILKANPNDSTAQKMHKRVIALLSVPTEAQIQQSSMSGPAQQRISKMFLVLLGVGGLFVGAGLFVPSFRNLVGVGAAMIFMTLAANFYLRRV